MPFKIRTKLITAFIGLISVILGIAGGIAYYNQRALHKAIQCSEDADEKMQLVSIFQLALDRVLMPGNDYIITGDRKYVSEFETASYGMENGIKMLEESMAHLRGSMKAGEIKEEEEIFRDVKAAWQNIKDISLMIFAIPDPARDKTAAMLMEEMDYKWAYPAVKRLDRLNEMSRKGHKEGIEAVYKAWRRSWFIMGVGALFLLAAGVSFALLYSRLFVGPIKRLHSGADAIARGEFKTRLDIKTGDELQQLSGAMNEMAEKLDSFYGTLENQVMERTRELQESEDKYRTMIESANDMIWALDREGLFIFINNQAGKIGGYTVEETLGKHYLTFVHPEDKAMREEYFKRTLSGERTQFTIRALGRKDHGERILILQVSSAPIYKEGKIVGTVNFGRDITELKKTEEALKESEERYRIMIETSNDWIWTLTPDGRLTFINKVAEDVSGHSPEEWIGKTFEPLVLEEDLPMVLDVHNRVVKGEKAHYEVRVKRKDGGVIILSVNASPIFKDGQVTGTMSFGRDITEKVRAEEALKQRINELEQFRKVTIKRELRMEELQRKVGIKV